MTTLCFYVEGIPVPQGSKSVSRSGHLFDSNAKKLKPWRRQIADVIRATEPRMQITDPVSLSVIFKFPRPASHFNKSGLKLSSPKYMQVKPDLDKLIRAVGDGVATDAGLLKDDSLIVSINAEKRYCIGSELPGALITIIVL